METFSSLLAICGGNIFFSRAITIHVSSRYLQKKSGPLSSTELQWHERDGRALGQCSQSFYFAHMTEMWQVISKWLHQMERFSALLALCAGNSPIPVNSPHKGQWRGALMFSLICVWINDWVNNREAGVLRQVMRSFDISLLLASTSCRTMDPFDLLWHCWNGH